jgi:hypothetical protein
MIMHEKFCFSSLELSGTLGCFQQALLLLFEGFN